MGPRPRLVHVFSSGQIVVVDEIHPVAWLLDDAGQCRQQLSWAQLPQPARDDLVGPRRRSFSVAEDLVSVHDLGVPHSIELRADDAGAVRWSPGPASSSGEGTARRSVTRKRFTTVTLTWSVRSRADGPRRWVQVIADAPHASWTWTFGKASASAAVAHDDGVLMVFREADKRPWEFDPPRRVLRLTATAGAETWELPPLEHPWTPHDVPLDDQGQARAIEHSLADLKVAVTQLRATHPEVSVVQPPGGPPKITATFTMPDGRRLRRTNEPFDILGNRTAGLAGLSIWLEEDILGGIGAGVLDGDRI